MSKITRRRFLKRALAISALPLVLHASTTKETLRFIHITDSHMDLADSDTVDGMELMVEYINENYSDVDFVLFGGDNYNNNVAQSKDAIVFKNIIDDLHCPSYLVKGNKESSPKNHATVNLNDFQEMFGTAKEQTFHKKDWLVTTKGYNILGIDSCLEGANNGLFSEETLNFAQEVLEQGKPTLILSHHPYSNYWHTKSQKQIHEFVLNNTDEIQKRLFTYDNLILTLSGHRHLDSVTHINNTKVIVTVACEVPVALDTYPMRYIEIKGNVIKEKLIYTE